MDLGIIQALLELKSHWTRSHRRVFPSCGSEPRGWKKIKQSFKNATDVRRLSLRIDSLDGGGKICKNTHTQHHCVWFIILILSSSFKRWGVKSADAYLRDLRLSFSMLFSGPSLSYEARWSSAVSKQQFNFPLQTGCKQNWQNRNRNGIELNTGCEVTDHPRWRQAWWRGTGGCDGLCQTDKSPDAKPETRSPALRAPTVSV